MSDCVRACVLFLSERTHALPFTHPGREKWTDSGGLKPNCILIRVNSDKSTRDERNAIRKLYGNSLASALYCDVLWAVSFKPRSRRWIFPSSKLGLERNWRCRSLGSSVQCGDTGAEMCDLCNTVIHEGNCVTGLGYMYLVIVTKKRFPWHVKTNAKQIRVIQPLIIPKCRGDGPNRHIKKKREKK